MHGFPCSSDYNLKRVFFFFVLSLLVLLFFFYCFFFSAVSRAQTPWIQDSLYYCFWGFVVLHGWQIHELLRKLYMGWGSCPPGLLSSFFFFIHSLRFIQRRLSCILFFFSLFLSICTPDFFFFRLYSIRYTLCCKQDGCRWLF